MTMVQATGLARLQEEKFLDHRQPLRPRPPPPNPSPSPLRAIPTIPVPSLPPLLPPPPRSNPLTLKCLSPEEIILHRKRGLCFNCEEKFHRGHKCASRVFLLITDETEPVSPHIAIPDPPENPPPDPLDSPNLYLAQISLNSLVGHIAPETLRLVDSLAGQQLVLLFDGGSTHNFIQQQLVTQLGLSCRETNPLWVMVGNGQYLECHCICEDIAINIQDLTFTIDLYVSPISGANVVLGVQWLKSLGLVLTDYTAQNIQFIYEGHLVNLQGDNEANLSLLTSP